MLFDLLGTQLLEFNGNTFVVLNGNNRLTYCLKARSGFVSRSFARFETKLLLSKEQLAKECIKITKVDIKCTEKSEEHGLIINKGKITLYNGAKAIVDIKIYVGKPIGSLYDSGIEIYCAAFGVRENLI